jgi:PIN domain nuclease of toxin-antitoxin system
MDDPQLSAQAKDIIQDGSNEILLSAASAWEIAIKAARGRLLLPETPDRYVSQRMLEHHLEALPVLLSHALQVYHLPPIHADPFDRLLVAQCQIENIPILSADPNLPSYGIEVIW